MASSRKNGPHSAMIVAERISWIFLSKGIQMSRGTPRSAASGNVQKACPRGGGESVQQGLLAYYVLEGVSFVFAVFHRGQPLVDARSVHLVREHGKMATCLP